MSGTIRSRTEEQRDRHYLHPDRDQKGDQFCRYCVRTWPCPDWVAADDTLTDLAALEAILREITDRHPRETWPDHPACGIADRALRILIPDPDARDWPMPKPPPYPADDENDA